MTTKEAFDRVYSRTKPEGGCLVFVGAKDAYGYGAIKVNGKKRSTHSVVAEYTLGARPEGLEVRHVCGRGHAGCVTASHLRYGTRSENTKDAVRHGTHPRVGKPDLKRVLTPDQVHSIREQHKRGLSQRVMAHNLNVPRSAIRRVLNGTGYREIV